eukprot:1622376-Pleurochrysis_carterae.AAC.2
MLCSPYPVPRVSPLRHAIRRMRRAETLKLSTRAETRPWAACPAQPCACARPSSRKHVRTSAQKARVLARVMFTHECVLRFSAHGCMHVRIFF